MEIIYQTGDEPAELDSIYIHDAVKMTAKGAILMCMGKPLRSNEPDSVKRFLKTQGIPALGEIKPPGHMEGDDIVWLGNWTVALGLGFRTNLPDVSPSKVKFAIQGFIFFLFHVR